MQVYRRAGFPAFEAELGRRGPEWQKVAEWITYQTAPRAMIFRRDEGAVRDVEDMKRQMRYNDYKHDPVSAGHRGLSLRCKGYSCLQIRHVLSTVQSQLSESLADTAVTATQAAVQADESAVRLPPLLPPLDASAATA